jgi:hypothetical protein
MDKELTLTLANGKTETFKDGYDMYMWFIKQKGLGKKKIRGKELNTIIADEDSSMETK